MKIKIKLKPLQEVIKKQLAAIEISKAQNEAQLEEISVMGGEAVAGPASIEKEELDEENIEEMYSDSGKRGMIGLNYGGGEEEHEGHVEKSKYLGLKNVMESE